MSEPVAYYIRTSTGRQDGEAQRHALRQALAAREPDTPYQAYEDLGCTGKHDRRPALQQLLADTRAGAVRRLYFYALSRLGRSLVDTVRIIDDLSSQGVELICLRDPVDTTTPTGRAFVGIAAVFAQLEREYIEERTRAGLAARRARGQRLGRPRRTVDKDTWQWVLAMRPDHSIRHMSAATGVPRETLRKLLIAHDRNGQKTPPGEASENAPK